MLLSLPRQSKVTEVWLVKVQWISSAANAAAGASATSATAAARAAMEARRLGTVVVVIIGTRRLRVGAVP